MSEPVPEVDADRVLTPREAGELFDRKARQYLGMSGREFAHRYEAGEFDEWLDSPALSRVTMLLPLARFLWDMPDYRAALTETETETDD